MGSRRKINPLLKTHHSLAQNASRDDPSSRLDKLVEKPKRMFMIIVLFFGLTLIGSFGLISGYMSQVLFTNSLPLSGEKN